MAKTKMKVLQIDGGGIRGIMAAGVCAELERAHGKPLNQVFDLMSGTSTGAIITSLLGAGVPAKVIYDIYVTKGKSVFKKRPWYKRLVGVKYDRSAIVKIMNELIKKYGTGDRVSDAGCDVISTTFNGCSGRTHYIKSWKPEHKNIKLIDAISWSALSAVHFFGPIAVADYVYKSWYQRATPIKAKGALFFDGGQGRNNCTLSECVVTVMKRGWLDENRVDLLSIGTGAPMLYKAFRAAKKAAGRIANIKSYITQSRLETVHDQLHKTKAIEIAVPNLNIHRLDCVISEKENSLDALGAIPNFVNYGLDMLKRIPKAFLPTRKRKR